MTKNKLINNDTGELDVTPPRVALTRLEHVRDELSRIYRLARTDKIEPQTGTRLTYILVNLAKIIESTGLEKRLDALESELRREYRHVKK